jgi:hypothetical protein
MSDIDEMGPGWLGAAWSVRIIGGAPLSDDKVVAPMHLDPVLSQVVGGEPGHDMLYGPVLIRGDASSLSIQVPAEITRGEMEQQLEDNGYVGIGYEDVRVMWRPTFEFDHWGSIRITGFEETISSLDGGSSVLAAVWEVRPYSPDQGGPDDE